MNYLLINGYSRSGSTILEKVLSNHLNSIAVGELNFIWSRGFLRNDSCSCGKNFRECDFWGKIYNHYKKNKINIKKIENNRKKIDRNRFFLLYEVFKIKNNKYIKSKNDYKKDIKYLINLINNYSKKKIIIDSSKKPSHSNLINELFDAKNIHIIRKLNGVISSYRKEMDYDKKNKIIFKKKSIFKTFIEWTLVNILVSKLKYNQLILEIDNQSFNLKTIINELDFGIYSSSSQGIYHSVSGNPARFKKITIFDHKKLKSEIFNPFFSFLLNIHFNFIIKAVRKFNSK